MKRAIFIGDRDKTDLLFYTAKTLAESGLRVLIVDATALQSYEFSYPVLDVPGQAQEYDRFEVWIPARGEQVVAHADYDFVLYDTDNPFRLAELPEVDHRFLVFGCEQTSIRRSIRLLESFFAERPIAELSAFHKVWIEGAREPGEAYINEQFEAFPIDWKESFVYYPDERDFAVKIANQYASSVKLKGLSAELKHTVQGIVSLLLEQDGRETRKLWKKAERSK